MSPSPQSGVSCVSESDLGQISPSGSMGRRSCQPSKSLVSQNSVGLYP